MIKRYFTQNNLQRIKNDFNFLIKFINNSYGEFDFAIRDNYFNIYYKGNSAAKIKFSQDNYRIEIHQKFFNATQADNPKFFIAKITQSEYSIINLCAKQLHPFLQSKHLMEFAARIKKVNNGEEIDFEQSLITDNLNREDIIFIDRQTTDPVLKGKRLDLLALKQVDENKYQFLVAEVKLGNNKELKDKVAQQLSFYVNHIQNNFVAYKTCYEKYYLQKKELGLIQLPNFYQIEIVEPVDGVIIVGGYSGIALNQIDILKQKFPNLSVVHLTNKL